MTPWERAVEAMARVDRDSDGIPIDGPEAPLLAAAPHLERHFRAKLAEELRAEAKRCDPTNAYPRGPGRWLDAADHLVRVK